MKNFNSYDWLTKISNLNFKNKSVLLVGAGNIGWKYADALTKLKVKDVIVISKSKKNLLKLCDTFGFKPLEGGYIKHLKKIERKDLVIIATPIPILLPAAQQALDGNQNNILIEKPASVFSKELDLFSRKIGKRRIRVAYNRPLYNNFQKLKYLALKEGRITSCHFNLTERIHTINFLKDNPEEIYRRWGISNSTHVLSMVIRLVGFPKKITSYQAGKFSWHKAGSIFVGGGVSEQNIPFSYHADWNSSGGWGVDIMTEKNIYRLLPLEDLFVLSKNSKKWKRVQFRQAFPNVKEGIAEELAVMLCKNIEKFIPMFTIKDSFKINKMAEKIFGYGTES